MKKIIDFLKMDPEPFKIPDDIDQLTMQEHFQLLKNNVIGPNCVNTVLDSILTRMMREIDELKAKLETLEESQEQIKDVKESLLNHKEAIEWNRDSIKEIFRFLNGKRKSATVD